RATALMQFGTQGSDRTATARQPVAIFDLYLDKATEPLFGRIRLVQFLQQLPESRKTQLDDGIANLVLGLEVVVDIAQGDAGFLGDIGDRGGGEAVPISDLLRGFKEPCA